MTVASLSKKQVVYNEDDLVENIYFVQSGEICLYQTIDYNENQRM